MEGRLEEVLHFSRRDGGSEPVAVQPLRFYEVMEILPASGWQVIHEEQGLCVLLTGVRDPSLGESLRGKIERMLEQEGALVPPVRVRLADALERGATGKAPLILSRIRNMASMAAGD